MAVPQSSKEKKGRGGGTSSTHASSSKKRKFDGQQSKKPQVSSTSQSSASNKKRALKHERQSHRRHADLVRDAKEIWNKLRLKSNTPDQVTALMSDLMTLIEGKTNEIAMQHDASRVVQAAIQFGSPDQRKKIVSELCKDGNLAELAKVQYAHFVVLKMIKYCGRDEECVKLIDKALKGQIPKLAVHAVGARVVELLFATLSPKETASLKLEMYGPQFALFADSAGLTHPTLSSVVEKHPNKKALAMEHVLGILNKGVEKSLFGFAYYQQLFSEYIAVASPNDIRSMASNVVDNSIHMLSTRPGALVVAAFASYATPKDRKRIMRSLKGYTRSSLLHHDAYIVILRLVDVTDDTVSVHKSILCEILTDGNEKTEERKEEEGEKSSPLLDLALSDTAAKLFLLLLSDNEEKRRKHLDPYELDVLKRNPTVTENGEEVSTSKKNPDTRRRELLQYLKKPLSDLCVQHADELLRSRPGSRVLLEVWNAFPSPEMADAVSKACVASYEAGNEAGNDENEQEKKDEALSIFEDPVGHLTLKKLLLSEEDVRVPLFAAVFHENFGTRLMEIASSNRGAFVVTSLAKVKPLRKKVLKESKYHEDEIRALAEQNEKEDKGAKKATAGYDALLREIADEV